MLNELSIRLMMKIFKTLSSIRLITGMTLLFFASMLHADEAVKRSEKNDKVVTGSASVQNGSNEQPGTAGKSKHRTESRAWVLHAEQWELARSGESVLALPVLNQVVNAWLLQKEKKIEIQYPGGEEGEFWVQQLTDWLVSLGIPSGSMVTAPGSGADDMIKFGLIK